MLLLFIFLVNTTSMLWFPKLLLLGCNPQLVFSELLDLILKVKNIQMQVLILIS